MGTHDLWVICCCCCCTAASSYYCFAVCLRKEVGSFGNQWDPIDEYIQDVIDIWNAGWLQLFVPPNNNNNNFGGFCFSYFVLNFFAQINCVISVRNEWFHDLWSINSRNVAFIFGIRWNEIASMRNENDFAAVAEGRGFLFNRSIDKERKRFSI